jgi:hypothetical protein
MFSIRVILYKNDPSSNAFYHGDRSAYLHLDRVLVHSKEHFDAQMLRGDPFEKQLDLPALFVQ